MPIVELDQEQYDQLSDGMRVSVDADGERQVATVTL